MKALGTFWTAIVLGFLVSVPSIGWAETGHHGGGSQMHHGSQQQHTAMSRHQETMDKVFEDYFAIHTSLAADSMESVPAKAKAMAEAIESLQGESMKCCGRGHESGMHAMMSDMGAAAGALAEQKDIDSARREFGRLSEKLVEYKKNHGKNRFEEAHVFVCDMAKQVWLQDSEELRNPYYGSAMLTCGRRVQ